MKSFAIIHPLGFSINAQFSEPDALKFGQPGNQTSNGYSWYSLPKLADDMLGEQVEIGLSVCFFAGKLVHINLAAMGAEFGLYWDDFSEEKEKKRAAATKLWLTKNHLKLGVYDWGTVDCSYDQKAASGCGAIWLFCNQNVFLGQQIHMDEFAALRQLMINGLSAFYFKKTSKKSFEKLIGFSQSMLDDTYQQFPEAENAAQSLLVVKSLLTFVLKNDNAETKKWLSYVKFKKPQLRALLQKFS